MRLRTFIKFVYEKFGERSFTSSQIFQDHYSLYPNSMDSVYTAVHKCWRMGALKRRKLRGNKYRYWLTTWGVRYATEGYTFRQDRVWTTCLSYVVKYGDSYEKWWAEKVIVPKLLQRFFPGRKAQDIKPRVDLYKAAENVGRTLKMRIKDETIIPDIELHKDRLRDSVILLLVGELMSQLYPDTYTPLNFKEIRGRIFNVLYESIEEAKNPREYVAIHRFRTSLERGHMWARPVDTWEQEGRPNIEERPNQEERIRLEQVIKKLGDILEKDILMWLEIDQIKTHKEMVDLIFKLRLKDRL